MLAGWGPALCRWLTPRPAIRTAMCSMARYACVTSFPRRSTPRTLRIRSARLPSKEMRALERAYSGRWINMSLLSGMTSGLQGSRHVGLVQVCKCARDLLLDSLVHEPDRASGHVLAECEEV